MKSTKECKEKAEQAKSDVLKLRDELEMIVAEHDFYTFENEHDVEDWLSSMPIETLGDSMKLERGNPLGKYTLSDFKTKSKLKKDFQKAKDVLENKITDMNIAHIELLIAKVDGYINEEKV